MKKKFNLFNTLNYINISSKAVIKLFSLCKQQTKKKLTSTLDATVQISTGPVSFEVGNDK